MPLEEVLETSLAVSIQSRAHTSVVSDDQHDNLIANYALQTAHGSLFDVKIESHRIGIKTH